MLTFSNVEHLPRNSGYKFLNQVGVVMNEITNHAATGLTNIILVSQHRCVGFIGTFFN